MPDYIQLLESKLSTTQRQALNAVTDVARARGVTVFLTGGAVRDIVSGASVRDLDITVQGNPLKFKKELEKAGFAITGAHEPSQTLYLRFGGRARVEISASRSEAFPKPARPEYHPAAILDDLRRRDFTANAMALSLNQGSWGLLLDPLNGTADIYTRSLRLVSNYGFLEDPIRLVRAVRLLSRTGWEMDERTKARYENAKAEGVISSVPAAQRGYELEEIAYEEEPLQVLKALEAEGWMEHLSPTWSSRSADAQGLERLHDRLVQLLMAGLQPDPSAAQFRLMTSKLSSAHLAALKRLFVRSDLAREAEVLDTEAKKVLQQMSAKDAAKPSRLWKLLHSVKPEAVLWLFFTVKGATIQNRFESFFKKWPEARQKIPNAILQDMRILPDVKGYDELLDKLTFAFMDDELPNEEAIRKFAEPYSPPAPPPPVVVRRGRAVKRAEPKAPKKSKKAAKQAANGDAAAAVVASAESAVTPAVAPQATKSKPVPATTKAQKQAAAAPAKASEQPAKATQAAKPAATSQRGKAAVKKSKTGSNRSAGTSGKAAGSKAAKVKPSAAASRPAARKSSKARSKPAAKSASKVTARKAATVHKPTAKKAIARAKKKAASKSKAKASRSPAKSAAHAKSKTKASAKNKPAGKKKPRR
jgi:tRNA nucleotidyltransferase (CCA-adding enzyme)